MGWIMTISLSVACTLATSTAIYYASKYLIREHHNVVKKNEYRTNVRKMKKILNSAKQEFSLIQAQIKPSSQDSKEKLARDSEPVDDNASVTSSSTLVLSSKKVLELEEYLTRILERIDTIKPKSSFDDVLPFLSPSEITQFESTTNSIIVSKKKLIHSIHLASADLANCQESSNVPK